MKNKKREIWGQDDITRLQVQSRIDILAHDRVCNDIYYQVRDQIDLQVMIRLWAGVYLT